MATSEAPLPIEHLVAGLAALSERRFIEVFYAAASRRSGAGSGSSLEDWSSHFVLAEAERVGAGPWEIDFLAPPREQVADPRRVTCRETTCPRCRTPVRSWARKAGCPVCGRTVYCN